MTLPRDAGTYEGPRSRLWLADLLWRLGCVQFGDFSLGRTVRNSPIYINPKLIISQPDALARVGQLMDEELQPAMSMRNPHVERFDLIVGVPIGGLHIATALSLQTRMPLVYPRPRAPGDEPGRRPQIEGSYRPGQVVLISDDLISHGGSVLRTAAMLEEFNMEVRDAVVLVDRSSDAAERLSHRGYNLIPILKLRTMLTYYYETGLIHVTWYDRSMQYLEERRRHES